MAAAVRHPGPCQAWLAAQPSTPVATMPVDEAHALLASGDQQRLLALMEQDSAGSQSPKRG